MTVYQIQCLLGYLGYNVGLIDGISGNQTKEAIEDFQKDTNLIVDGIVGESTQEALLNAVSSGSFRKTEEVAKSSSTTTSFWDEIQYFTRDEFRCHCNGRYCNGFPVEPAETLVRVADRVRIHFGAPITISSGIRCSTHNANVGGVCNSRHLIGHAMDYCVQGHTADEILAFVSQQTEIKYCYAINKNYVHMDIGG